MLSECFGILSHAYCECLKKMQRDPTTRYDCQTIAGVGIGCSWYICLTPDFKFHPEDSKKIMGHGIAPIYTGIYLACISERSCKCSGQHFGERDRTRQYEFSVTFCDKMLKGTLLPADLPGNTKQVHTYVYRCYNMSHECFRVFRMKFGVWSQTYVPGTPNSPPRLSSGNCISWWDLFVFFLRHSQYACDSIPKIPRAFGGHKNLQK
jgi:hypothetical protein